ncbi:hypothetical protein BH09SUM1_BH09SUM1_27620 [soil metagenome]
MHRTWISDFFRQTLSHGGSGDGIHGWSRTLVETLDEAKKDCEIHLFGVCRVKGMPNYLLATTEQKIPKAAPLKINVTEKTAEIFLSPVQEGVRIIQQDLPMIMLYEIPGDPERKKHEIAFYEAICFDILDYSLVIGLVLSEGTAAEFLSPEEVAEILPAIRAQGLPLFELMLMRDAVVRLQEEVQLVMGVVRESSPEIRKLSFGQPVTPPPISYSMSQNPQMAESAFLQYTIQELRAPMTQLIAANEEQIRLCENGSKDGKLLDLSRAVRSASAQQMGLLKNLGSVAALMHNDVKPRAGSFPLQTLVRELNQAGSELASGRGIRIVLDENTRNVHVSGDRETLFRMGERFMDFAFQSGTGADFYIRSDNRPERVEPGFVLLEFEDLSPGSSEMPPSQLLNRQNLVGTQHPRLRRGGGILFQLLSLYMEKSGGKFRLATGPNGGFAAQMFLPVVARPEREKTRSGNDTSGGL